LKTGIRRGGYEGEGRRERGGKRCDVMIPMNLHGMESERLVMLCVCRKRERRHGDVGTDGE
jgi:hypothetical protein